MEETEKSRKETTKNYKCSECNQTFKIASKLAIHKRIHTGEKPFKCTNCDKKFSQSGNLSRHLLSCLGGVKQYTCQYCNNDFAGDHLSIYNSWWSLGSDLD